MYGVCFVTVTEQDLEFWRQKAYNASWIAWFGDRLVFQKQTEIFGKWMCSRPQLEERGNTYQSVEAALFMGADSQVASPRPCTWGLKQVHFPKERVNFRILGDV
jgi:hypothetical protein